MAGWANSNRRDRLPPDWWRLRALVKRRAGGQCEHVTDGVRCGTEGTDCDHVIAGDDHSLENLQWLCKQHHQAKTIAEREAARPKRQRSPERHPGALD